MLTPNGQPANTIERVMLLSMWAHALQKEHTQSSSKPTFITAGIGKPTYPINPHTITSYLNYWQKMDTLTQQWFLNPHASEEETAIDYGDPHGDYEPRALMAKMMSAWYTSTIEPENILFTVGGLAGLRLVFEALHARYRETPGYRIITPFPHYSAYAQHTLHRLHPVYVMKEPGYKLTAHNLEVSIQEAYQLAKIDGGLPKAVLICNPSNPLGTVIDAIELEKIAAVLRSYPNLHLIFDEAYAEMCYIDMPSFLQIAPDLKDRTIILRSATKALSAAGERMAVLLVFNPLFMQDLLHKNIHYVIHAPRSAQMAYAHTMQNLDLTQRQNLTTFYKEKVHYVLQRLRAMGAGMPDPAYRVDATFYALGDFSELFGLPLPDAAERALQKKGVVTSGEDLAYYLLFEDGVMIAPLSYFGLPNSSGVMRITCSGNEQTLKALMDRLEQRLIHARKIAQSS